MTDSPISPAPGDTFERREVDRCLQDLRASLDASAKKPLCVAVGGLGSSQRSSLAISHLPGAHEASSHYRFGALQEAIRNERLVLDGLLAAFLALVDAETAFSAAVDRNPNCEDPDVQRGAEAVADAVAAAQRALRRGGVR